MERKCLWWIFSGFSSGMLWSDMCRKNYMEYKYGIKVEVKENGKQLGEEKTSFMLSTFKTKDKWLKAGEKLASES